MSAAAAAIGDDLAALLAGQAWLSSAEVERDWRPSVAPVDGAASRNLSALRVEVVPGTITPERQARAGRWQRRYRMGIVVSKKTDGTKAAADAVVAVAEEIGTLLEDTDTLATTGASIVNYSIDPAVAPEHVDQFRVVTSLIQVELIL